MTGTSGRRRVIKLMAAGVAVAALPRSLWADAAGSPLLQEWRGFAMGADVSLQLYHHDPLRAQHILEQSVTLIRDMENLFSLYQPESTISRLNRQGRVDEPDADFVDLLQVAHRISRITSGAFDITVQPLWRLYDHFFSQPDNADKVVPAPMVQEAGRLVGYEKISISPHRVSFDQPGMAVTLNGIAQGYVTDRVCEYLRRMGMMSVLVDIGEYRALGPQADGAPWRIGLADPYNFGAFTEILELAEGAVATSSGVADRFDRAGRYHHLFDPISGDSPHLYSSVTVTAPTAALADALSTAFYLMPENKIRECLISCPDTTVRLLTADRKRITLSA